MNRSYRYLTKGYEWSEPIEAASARDALSKWLALPPGATAGFDKEHPRRIIKVDASGELLELNRGADGQWR